MIQQKKSFGHAAPRRVAPAPLPRAPAAEPEIANYDWLTQPLRDGVRESIASEGDLPGRILRLFTRSPYRHWLWIACGGAAFLVFQLGLLGGGIMIPQRTGHDYVGGDQPREAAHIVDFSLDGEGFHEETDLMAENIEIGGTLINTTEERIWQVTLRAVMHDCTGELEAEDCPVAWDGVLTFSPDVPPGEQVEFAERIPVAKLPLLEGEAYARYEILAVSTKE
ncbi:MAG: hypothetical protein WD673_10660 [Alphaproteobacteria bacterium]